LLYLLGRARGLFWRDGREWDCGGVPGGVPRWLRGPDHRQCCGGGVGGAWQRLFRLGCWSGGWRWGGLLRLVGDIRREWFWSDRCGRWGCGGGVVSSPQRLVYTEYGSSNRALLRHARSGAVDLLNGSSEDTSPSSLPSLVTAPTTMSASVSRNRIRHLQLRLAPVTSDSDAGANTAPSVGAALRGARSPTPVTPSIPHVAHSGE
jgi:hypothetical protein